MVLADITNSLLGFDFLNNFCLIVDFKHKYIRHNVTERRDKVKSIPCSVNLIINELNIHAFVRKLINNCPGNSICHHNIKDYYRGFFHRKTSTGFHPKKANYQGHRGCTGWIQKLQKISIISSLSSQWASPYDIETERFLSSVCWFWSLKSITKTDRYPIPNIISFNSKVVNKCCFSETDLTSAYHQIRVHIEDVLKTDITNLFVLFEFNSIAFELKKICRSYILKFYGQDIF